MRVLVLGAGFGGLELATSLLDDLGDEVQVTLIDKNDSFVFGFSKLDVMFGRTTEGAVRHYYRDLSRPQLEFVKTTITAIDPATKTATTEAGTFSGDVLVVALGADYDLSATPGLKEFGHEFYTVSGAFSCREVLETFTGGKVLIGVCGTPFKCPPAPSEAALMVHDLLTRRGLREQSTIDLVTPLPAPVPPSPDTSAALLAAFAERNIGFHPGTVITHLTGEPTMAVDATGEAMAFDLFLGVPRHVAPSVLESSGLLEDGWIPVDYFTLATKFTDVFAIGDCTSVGTPKAGVFSEGQAAVVAQQLAAKLRGTTAATYDGTAACYLEFGHEQVGRVNIQFLHGEAPHGTLTGPHHELVAEKAAFGGTRIARWFGHEWSAS